MSKKILLIGAGGHCKSVLDILINSKNYDEIGIIDNNVEVGYKVLNTPVIGSDDKLVEFFENGFNFAFIAIGSIGNPSIRIRIYNELKSIGFIIPNIIDPTAIVSDYITIEDGVFVGKGAIINTDARIGKGAIINTGALIEHECSIGDFTHISPSVVLCGNVSVGNNTHIGANTVVRQSIEIGSNVLVGIGSTVVNNIENDVVAYGNPCKEVK